MINYENLEWSKGIIAEALEMNIYMYDQVENLYPIIKNRGHDYENKMLEMPIALWDFLLQNDRKLDIGVEINRNIEKYLSEIPIFEEKNKSIYKDIKKRADTFWDGSDEDRYISLCVFKHNTTSLPTVSVNEETISGHLFVYFFKEMIEKKYEEYKINKKF